jgi:hypothetical protein
MKINFNKKWIYRLTSGLLIFLICISCGIAWYENHGEIFKDEYQNDNSPIIYKTNSVSAGEDAEFIMYVKCASNYDNETHRLIVAVNVPKVWTEARNAIITWENNEDMGVERTMSPIAEGASPKNKPGLSWDQALLNTVGGRNPNILDDMQWIAFQADDPWSVHNGGNAYTLFLKIRIKIKTGPDNLRAKIGFFANYDGDGLGGDEDHWKVMWGDCFEVTDGEGAEPIDFCQYHFNQATPGNATQSDIITFKYIGDYYVNPLISESDIYLNAKAYTVEGNTYTVNEISDKTKLRKDSKWEVMWSATVWPEGFFGVPANETIDRIEYYFTNSDGTLYVSKYDDDVVRDAEPGYEEELVRPGRPVTPFVYYFVCK